MSLKFEDKRISQAVLEKITKENLKMRSLFYFVSVSLVWRALAALILLFSAIVFSVTLYEVLDLQLINQWKLGFDHILETFPFFLLIAGLFLVYFSSRLYRKSRICCRHEDWALFFALAAVALAVSAYFYFSDLAMYFYESADHYPLLKLFII